MGLHIRSIPSTTRIPKHRANRARIYLQKSFVVPLAGWGIDPIQWGASQNAGLLGSLDNCVDIKVSLKWIEYGVYGDLSRIYAKPYSIYLRGTIYTYIYIYGV